MRFTKFEYVNALLQAEIAELRSRLKTDSHNSSKPPSSVGPGSTVKPKQVAITRQAYALYGASNRLVKNIFPGEHRWCGEQEIPWLFENLAA